MPCFDPDRKSDTTQLNETVSALTAEKEKLGAMLCGFITATHLAAVEHVVYNSYNSDEAGVSWDEIVKWYNDHVQEDRKRKEAEEQRKREEDERLTKMSLNVTAGLNEKEREFLKHFLIEETAIRW